MATTFVNLPTNAANGPGTAVDVSGLSAVKTISNVGNGYVFEPFVTIEIATDIAGNNFVPIYTFEGAPREVTIPVGARWMRAVVANYRGGGAPQVDVGADAEAVSFAALIAPASSGSGAAVATNALPLFKTIVVAGPFRGTTNIEISEDGGTTWTTAASFQAPGFQNVSLTADFMRVTRAGVPGVNPGLPLVDIGAVSIGGGGADGGVALSAGTQSVSTGTVVLSNSNGVSFGMAGSQTVTASFAAIKSLSGGTSVASGPTVVFADSNGVSFGVNGNTITGSIAATTETPFGISAGTQSVSTGTMVFSNSNNITFGMSGSSRITASASFPAETPFGISAGTQSVSTGTVSFADSNGVTFGMSGSNTITASIATSLTNINLSAGTTSNNLSAVVFSNSNNVSFGLNGSTVTASASISSAPAMLSQFAPFIGRICGTYNVQNGSYYIAPYPLPFNLTFSQYNALVQHTANGASKGTISFTYLFGAYTKNVSTLSMLHSTSFTSSIPYDSGASASLFNGTRVAPVSWTSSMSAGDYWFGIGISTTNGSDNATIRLLWQEMAPLAGTQVFSGRLGSTSSLDQMQLGLGAWSAVTAAVPNSAAFSDLRGTLMDRMTPAFGFGLTV